jgi:hypothetical protein
VSKSWRNRVICNKTSLRQLSYCGTMFAVASAALHSAAPMPRLAQFKTIPLNSRPDSWQLARLPLILMVQAPSGPGMRNRGLALFSTGPLLRALFGATANGVSVVSMATAGDLGVAGKTVIFPLPAADATGRPAERALNDIATTQSEIAARHNC